MDTLPVPTHDPEAWAERIAASLRAERDGIHEFLASQEQRLKQAETALQELLEQFGGVAAELPASGATDGDIDRDSEEDYRRRYEMALDDLRELKAGNALLQEQLSKARSTASALAKQTRAQSPCLDWEAEKLRILAALESDLDENDAEQRAERIKMEDVVRATDRAIAQKNSEIQELKRQLEDSSHGAGAVAEAAAALAHALDSDTAVREERKRLQQLEEQVQGKLRQAEVEISVERAKLARGRVELEERMRSIENDNSKASATAGAADPTGQPVRGRWMSRLGLTDADRERRRNR